ncbi:MAG TPA: sensor domain-containing diguanylate cyclase [Gammaproteobacteria bacterium]|nr:sensor domain-containing diguanylate cyclase [Gammaproteobacteria bacterium]
MSNIPALTETIASTATIKLAQLSESTFFCTPIEERFERITRLARRALHVPVAAITFLTEQKQWFKSVAGWSVTELPNEQSFCPITLAAGQMTIFEDTKKEPAVSKHPLVTNAPQFRFYAGLPIMDENGDLCGTFCVFDQKPRQLSPADKATLEDLAQLAQREILGERMKTVHTSLTAKLGIARRESMMDPLTRLWNRRGASVMIKGALDEAKRQGSSVAVAILDLDNFKQVNDTFGHQIGDEVLRKTALRLIQSLRNNDCVCRFGGDEFLLIMKDADTDTARAAAERIRRQVSETPIPTRHGDITVSTSIGFVVGAGETDTSVEDLIERADQALLKSKSQGRDRVVQLD